MSAKTFGLPSRFLRDGTSSHMTRYWSLHWSTPTLSRQTRGLLEADIHFHRFPRRSQKSWLATELPMTRRPEKSLEPTADRRTKKLEGREMIVESPAKLAA